MVTRHGWFCLVCILSRGLHNEGGKLAKKLVLRFWVGWIGSWHVGECNEDLVVIPMCRMKPEFHT